MQSDQVIREWSRAETDQVVNCENILAATPDLLPMQVNCLQDALYFVSMSRASYREYAFLDPRMLKGRDVYSVSLSRLIDSCASTPSQVKPPAFIVHGAFCCSTLLTRYLEALPSVFVLREPAVLTQIALARYVDFRTRECQYSWDTVFELVVRLLSRTYGQTDRVVVKTSDICTCLADRLVSVSNGGQVIVILAKLRNFLLSVLRFERRRRWVRRRLENVRLCSPDPGALVNRIDLTHLRDSEAAACLWLSYVDMLTALARSGRRKGILFLDGDDISDRPDAILPSVCKALRLDIPERTVSDLTLQPLSAYSKEPSIPFSAEQRISELSTANSFFGAEADAGIEFATLVAKDLVSLNSVEEHLSRLASDL
jgi:hypothetical protein